MNRGFLLQLWRHLGESVHATFTLQRHRVSYLSVAKGSLISPARVGLLVSLVGTHNGFVGVCVRSARILRYQQVGIGNVKWSCFLV